MEQPLSDKKLAFVVHGFPAQRLAGTELYVFHLAGEFQRCGANVRVIFPTYDRNKARGMINHQYFQNVKTASFNIHLKEDYVTRFKDDEIGAILAEYVAAERFDLIHFHHLIGFTGSGLKKCAQKGIPALFTVHDAWLLCDQSHLIRFDGHICQQGPETAETCAVCLLRRHPALKETISEDLMTNLQQWYFDQLSSILHSRKNVFYHGPYSPSDLPEVLAGLDVVVLPSRVESYSFVVRECLHARVPVVASRSGALPEIIKDKRNGFLFESDDYLTLATILGFLVRNPAAIIDLKRNIEPVRTIMTDREELCRVYDTIMTAS